MGKGTRQRIIRAACVAMALCGLLFMLAMPSDHHLLKRARIVEPREDFVYPAIAGRAASPLRLRGDWPYCWVTPHTLLTIHFSETSIMALKPRLTDLASGRRLPISRLTQFASGFSDDVTILGNRPPQLETTFVCQSSRDGAWILAPRTSYPEGPAPFLGAAVRVDDTHQVEWQISRKPESTLWMPDSRRWVALLNGDAGYQLALFDLRDPAGINRYEFDIQARADWNGVGHTGIPIAPTLAGTLPDGRILAINWSAPEKGQVLTARFLPNDEVEHPRKQRIPVPAGTAAVPLLPPVLSPSGDRVAWFVSVPRTPLGWPVTAKFWALSKTTPSVQIGLWTTGADGSDPQEVGVYTRQDPDDRPSLLQWTPDGRSLSFRYHGALYVVPAQ